MLKETDDISPEGSEGSRVSDQKKKKSLGELR